MSMEVDGDHPVPRLPGLACFGTTCTAVTIWVEVKPVVHLGSVRKSDSWKVPLGHRGVSPDLQNDSWRGSSTYINFLEWNMHLTSMCHSLIT